jgi:hypothetical protein
MSEPGAIATGFLIADEMNTVADAKSLKRKIERAKALPVKPEGAPEDESKSNSVSQPSYTQVAEHFDNLTETLS